DVVAIEHEKQLFTRVLTSYGDRVLREVESVATSEAAARNIRRSFDPEWAKSRVGLWLETYFDHDYVFIFDQKGDLIYSLTGNRAADPKWFATVRPDVTPIIEYVRGRDRTMRGAIRLDQTNGGARPAAAMISRLLGRPAVIAASAVGSAEGAPVSLDN